MEQVTQSIQKATILGTGSFGTALAILLANKGIAVCLWGRNQAVVAEINSHHTNTKALEGVVLGANIEASASMEKALEGSQCILVALPSQTIRSVIDVHKFLIPKDLHIVVCAKGIERTTLYTLDEVFAEVGFDPDHLFYLSGPSFAKEIVMRYPTAVCLAGTHQQNTKSVQNMFLTDYFRVYSSGDVKGVEIAGSLKNVMAIGAGIIDGLGFGKNTISAFITRGLAEILRLGVKLGAQPTTFLGLAGIGDLILTCTGDLSRNRSFGVKIAQGRTKEEAEEELGHVVEGVYTIEAGYDLAKKHGVEMPILEQLYAVLFLHRGVNVALKNLMERQPKEEYEIAF